MDIGCWETCGGKEEVERSWIGMVLQSSGDLVGSMLGMFRVMHSSMKSAKFGEAKITRIEVIKYWISVREPFNTNINIKNGLVHDEIVIAVNPGIRTRLPRHHSAFPDVCFHTD